MQFGVEIETLVLDPKEKCFLFPLSVQIIETCGSQNDVISRLNIDLKNENTTLVKSLVSNTIVNNKYKDLVRMRRKHLALYLINPSPNEPSEVPEPVLGEPSVDDFVVDDENEIAQLEAEKVLREEQKRKKEKRKRKKEAAAAEKEAAAAEKEAAEKRKRKKEDDKNKKEDEEEEAEEEEEEGQPGEEVNASQQSASRQSASRQSASQQSASQAGGGGIQVYYTDEYHGKMYDTENKPVLETDEKGWVIDVDTTVHVNNGKIYQTLNNTVFDISEHTIVENMEIVSPPIQINEDYVVDDSGLTYVFEILNKKENILKFAHNSTTSQHIHMSFPDLSSKYVDFPMKILKVCYAWWWFEPVFMSLVPSWRRNNNQYCKSMRAIIAEKLNTINPMTDVQTFSDHTKVFDLLNLNAANLLKLFVKKNSHQAVLHILSFFQGPGRYCALNLLNLLSANETTRTIEVRIKHGSNDIKELKLFVELFGRFFQQAMDKEIDWYITLFDESTIGIENFFTNDLQNNMWHMYIADPKGNNSLDLAMKKLCDFLFDTDEEEGMVSDEEKTQKTQKTQFYNDLSAQQKKAYENSNPVPLGYDAMDVVPVMTGGKTHKTNGASRAPRKFNLFSYGANSSERIIERLGASGNGFGLVPKGGYINDYVRIFAGWSPRWKGGVASIHQKKGSRVYGSVVKLTKEQLETLDGHEGGYMRETMTVVVGDSVPVKCFIYVKTNFEYSSPPSSPYLQAVKTMLHETCDRQHTNKIMIRGLVKNARGNWAVKTLGHYDKDGVLHMIMHDV
jgi:flagellar biosynthesis GTPase FlhF